MKFKNYLTTVFIILFSLISIAGQSFSSIVEITTIYSQNEKFYLKSIPYDNEEPSLRGKTYVYETGKSQPLYVFERGFDSVDDESNNLILSNNGEVVFYVITYGAYENKEGLKSISIYKKGQLSKSFTESEITGCDKAKERCELIYNNYEVVIDKEKSNFGTRNYKRTFKDGVSEKEKFLSDFAIFSFEDTVYLTDSKKKVHIFDLKEGKYIRSDDFENVYEQIKNNGRFVKTELQRFDSMTQLDFPKLQNGKDTAESLAAYLEMKTVDSYGTEDDQYKQYRFKINANILKDGSLEIEEIEIFDELLKEKILEFFKNNKFDSRFLHKEFDKWNLGDEYFSFRRKDDKLAREEKKQEEIEQQKALEKRLVAEKINDIYIPRNLGECFIEMDKFLKEIDRKEMQSLAKREDMIKYHFGLGMWMRNNWGLWGGSRLQKYFTERGTDHPDDMSSVVLFFYHDWLNNKKETWKEWENNPRDIFRDK